MDKNAHVREHKKPLQRPGLVQTRWSRVQVWNEPTSGADANEDDRIMPGGQNANFKKWEMMIVVKLLSVEHVLKLVLFFLFYKVPQYWHSMKSTCLQCLQAKSQQGEILTNWTAGGATESQQNTFDGGHSHSSSLQRPWIKCSTPLSEGCFFSLSGQSMKRQEPARGRGRRHRSGCWTQTSKAPSTCTAAANPHHVHRVSSANTLTLKAHTELGVTVDQ